MVFCKLDVFCVQGIDFALLQSGCPQCLEGIHGPLVIWTSLLSSGVDGAFETGCSNSLVGSSSLNQSMSSKKWYPAVNWMSPLPSG